MKKTIALLALLGIVFTGCSVKLELVDKENGKKHSGTFDEGMILPGEHKTIFNIKEKKYEGVCDLSGNNFIGYTGVCDLPHTKEDTIKCDVTYSAWEKNLNGNCENENTNKKYFLVTPK